MCTIRMNYWRSNFLQKPSAQHREVSANTPEFVGSASDEVCPMDRTADGTIV